jgi:hypothetical protein
MEITETRSATLALLGLSDEQDVAYIDDALLTKYADAIEADSPPSGDTDDAGSFIRVYYGNSLVPGQPKGRLYFRNGTPEHPNEPCGTTYHRWVMMTQGSKADPYRLCQNTWSYRITVY